MTEEELIDWLLHLIIVHGANGAIGDYFPTKPTYFHRCRMRGWLTTKDGTYTITDKGLEAINGASIREH